MEIEAVTSRLVAMPLERVGSGLRCSVSGVTVAA
jgi:hypothetical protein